MKQAAGVEGYEVAKQLYMAMELSSRTWKLGFSTGAGKIRIRDVGAGQIGEVLKEIAISKEKLRVDPGAPVVACFEAGRDGHWLYRWLISAGVKALEIDSSSIEKARHGRGVKTDRVDVEKLLDLLMRYHTGYRQAFRVVHVPSEEAEDVRRLHRERDRLVKERTRLKNQMRSHLVTVGQPELTLSRRKFEEWLEALNDGVGKPLPPLLKAELKRTWRRYCLTEDLLKEVETGIAAELEGDTRLGAQRRTLEGLKSIGPVGSRTLSGELFSWRTFRNGKQVGSAAGLTPTALQSGRLSREQGIGKQGNWRVRWVMIELSWQWLKHQPESALSTWYRARFGRGGKRMGRVGIVALARKLLVALWRYVEHGVVPTGAQFKPGFTIEAAK
jgi:transposase